MVDPVDTFRTEAREHLANLEEALLEMEQRPDDGDLNALAFRALHTIKGSGAMLGFDDLSGFAHHLETAFDKVRNGQYPVTPELVSVLLDAKDHIEDLLQEPLLSPAQQARGDGLLARLWDIIPAADSGGPPATPGPGQARGSDPEVFRVRFTPAPDTFAEGFDVLPILNELHALGDCHVTTLQQGLPPLAELDPEICTLSWDLILVTGAGADAIRDTFIFVAEDWDISVEPVDLGDTGDEQADQIGEILVERGLLSRAQVEQVLDGKPRTGDLLRQAGLVSESDVDTALAEQRAIRETRDRGSGAGQNAVVRVPAERLDKLMNLVGELVIVQARLQQLAQSREDEDVTTVSEDLDRLATELRDNTFSIRMLPIGTTFGRFRRLVRDLSRDLGKEIRLETEGAETELDKMVIDRLGDPLVHLIRNSIDHGIESPERREAAGKPRCGNILLSAQHAESHVLLRIRDDGAGLDSEAILAKARERGLLGADAQPGKEEILQLIFEPGFSTAKQVSDVSGRGVGMDVVRRSIQDLGGQVAIRSEPGLGTTLTINLPMTLAIIEGLMVAVSEERYVLPLNAVEECIEQRRADATRRNGRRLVKIRGQLVPYMRLREWFGVPGDGPDIEQIVVARVGEERFGFSVDQVVGQYQTVIKRLGKLYEGIPGLAGATILGDGGVAMILDAAGLVGALEQAGRPSTGRVH